MLTPEKIEELRGLLAKATPGPWSTHLVDDTTIMSPAREVATTCDSSQTDREDGYDIEYEQMEADAALIVAMRNALPALLDLAPKALATLSLAGEDARLPCHADEVAEIERRLMRDLGYENSHSHKAAFDQFANELHRMWSEDYRSLSLRVEAEKRAREEAQAACAFFADEGTYSDSYGVPGSDFGVCRFCEAGGAPGVPFEHNKRCPILRCEEVSAEWWAEREEERKDLAAAETHSAALARALEEAKGVWKPISALWSKPAECGKGCPPRQVCDFCQRELFLGWNGDYVELWNTTNYYLCRERSEPHWKHMAEEAARLTHFMAFDMPDRASSLLAPKEDTNA